MLGSSLSELTGCRLPLNLQVLRRYVGLREKYPPPHSTRDLLRIVLDEMCNKFWIPSRIPTKPEKNCLDQLVKLVSKYEQIMKFPEDRRQKKKLGFETEMNELCDIAHPNAENLMRSSGNPEWKVDIEFLQGQRQVPQIGVMMGHDNVLARKEKNSDGRSMTLSSRRKKEEERKKNKSIATVEESISSTEEEKEHDEEFPLPLSKKTKKMNSSMLNFLPQN